MKYKVIERFMDLEDNNFIYEVGWEYPRANHFVKEARIKELLSCDNRQGIPLIIEVGEVKEVEKPIEDEPVEEKPLEEEVVEETIEEPVEEKPKKAKKKK